MSDLYQILIEPQGISLELDSETSLLSALRDQDIYIKSSCGGYASCTDCIVKVIDGKEYLNDPTFDEKQLLGNVFHITKERLAC